jgi:DNA helicase-2/ATP-dependent DNA helicase PcrA
MRLPKISQLTEDQKRVYLYAPSDKHILVHGPPGTGKTLIACFRALELQKRNVPVVLCMYNRVLSKYAANVGDGKPMPVKTAFVWFLEWWQGSGLPVHPKAVGNIVIQAPFDQNADVKDAGARWNPSEWRPWGRGRGAWVIDAEKYLANPQLFADWRIWHRPPMVEGEQFQFDWDEVAKHIFKHQAAIPDQMLDLGTLLLDEGQDFSLGFYNVLRQISILSADPERKVTHRLRCFVLADENQQLTAQNSTLTQIADTLRIDDGNKYTLLDNFRNSKEIAELARRFFADVGVLPKLPKRSTTTPIYSCVKDHAAVVDRIKIWLTNNHLKEVGVLTFSDTTRNSLTESLKKTLGEMRGRDITVQTYSSKSQSENKAKDLMFDTPDVVTVLNLQSCKGLEFDAVFIVDLHEAQIGLYGVDRFKMQMFVAVSRARDWVSLIDSGSRAGVGKYFEVLPDEEFLERDSDTHTESGKKHPVRLTEVKAPTLPIPPKIAQRRQEKSESGATSEADLIKLTNTPSLSTRDQRSKGGAFWVDGGDELAARLQPLGFVYSAKRNGWWRK